MYALEKTNLKTSNRAITFKKRKSRKENQQKTAPSKRENRLKNLIKYC